MCRKGQRVREYSTERTHNGAIMRRWPSPVRCSVAELRWGSGTLPHGSAACPVAGADLDVIQCVVFLIKRSPPSDVMPAEPFLWGAGGQRADVGKHDV